MNNEDCVNYSGPVKEEYLTYCKICGKDIDRRWNFCPRCGKKNNQSTTKPFNSNVVTVPQSGQ